MEVEALLRTLLLSDQLNDEQMLGWLVKLQRIMPIQRFEKMMVSMQTKRLALLELPKSKAFMAEYLVDRVNRWIDAEIPSGEGPPIEATVPSEDGILDNARFVDLCDLDGVDLAFVDAHARSRVHDTLGWGRKYGATRALVYYVNERWRCRFFHQ